MVAQFLQAFRKAHADAPVAEPVRAHSDAEAAHHSTEPGKEVGIDNKSINGGSETHPGVEGISENAQYGVKKIEATTAIWSKNMLMLAYGLIFLIYFINSLQQGITGTLTPYVTSAFQQHSLTAVTGVVSSLVGGLTKLPLAKILDIWGRPQGFVIMLFTLVMGLIMMAACKNVTTYAAAQVFYWVGYNGLGYSMDIFISDTSSLKNRGLMYAFASSPYIVTTWCSGPAANSFLNGAGFRWGFGTFAIVTPAVCMPLFFLFIHNYRKAQAAGLMPPRDSGRTAMESLKHYAIEFDVIGLVLLAGGLAIFLLPFSLYSYQKDHWRSPIILGMLVGGIVTLFLFSVWEKHFAPKKFIPWELLTDRTVLGAYILSAVLFVEFYIWDSYFYSFLIVVNDLSVTNATYVTNTYSIGACLWAIATGIIIRYTGRFKYIALCFGVPVTIIGVGLMIHFRQPDTNIGYVVMCQILIALAGGTLVICEQIAALSATTHQYVAVVLAVESMFANIGGAIGQTIAAAIWTGVFPKKLAQYLPPESRDNLIQIYGDLTVQAGYEWGSPTRMAINRAYGDAQKMMLVASIAVLALGVVAVCFWRDIKIKDFKQVKGRVV